VGEVAPPVVIADAALVSIDVSPDVRQALLEQMPDVDIRVTDDPGSEALAALDEGARFLVAAGDDVTTNLVANAMLDRADHASLILGVLPLADSDLPRTFGLPQDPIAACRHLTGPNIYEMDAVLLETEQQKRWLLQVGEIGFGADMVSRRGRHGGRLRAFISFWRALARSPAVEVTIASERRSRTLRAWNVVLGNCQFFGGGVRISPRSYPGDGVLDVLVMSGSRSRAFTTLPRMSRGEHVPNDEVIEIRGIGALRIDAERPMPVHADGILVGTTPVDVRIEAKALRLKI
jgi:diacylglycerol kinase (ATP)